MLMMLAFFFPLWGAAPGPADLPRRVGSRPRPPLHMRVEALDGHATAADRCSCRCSVSGRAGGWVLGAGGWVCWEVGWPGPVLTAGVAGEVRGAGWSEGLRGSGGLRGSYMGGPGQRGPRAAGLGSGQAGPRGLRGAADLRVVRNRPGRQPWGGRRWTRAGLAESGFSLS